MPGILKRQPISAIIVLWQADRRQVPPCYSCSTGLSVRKGAHMKRGVFVDRRGSVFCRGCRLRGDAEGAQRVPEHSGGHRGGRSTATSSWSPRACTTKPSISAARTSPSRARTRTTAESSATRSSTPSEDGSAVTFENGETSAAVLTGFTITGGFGTLNNSIEGGGNIFWGGGIYCLRASPTITKNVIAGNRGPVVLGNTNADSRHLLWRRYRLYRKQRHRHAQHHPKQRRLRRGRPHPVHRPGRHQQQPHLRQLRLSRRRRLS